MAFELSSRSLAPSGEDRWFLLRGFRNSGAMRSWLAKAPNFAQTFLKRVLEEKDWPYWRSLIFRIYDACPADQFPDYLLKQDETPPD